jgi:hypothetical protein
MKLKMSPLTVMQIMFVALESLEQLAMRIEKHFEGHSEVL